MEDSLWNRPPLPLEVPRPLDDRPSWLALSYCLPGLLVSLADLRPPRPRELRCVWGPDWLAVWSIATVAESSPVCSAVWYGGSPACTLVSRLRSNSPGVSSQAARMSVSSASLRTSPLVLSLTKESS